MELAHLSDVHLGPLPEPTWQQLMSKRFFGYLSWRRRRHLMHRVELLARIRQDLHDNPPDHTAISGDLVNLSLPDEFTQAQKWLESLGSAEAISVIPGNHDAYAGQAYGAGWRLWDAYMRSDGATQTEFPTIRRRPGLVLIGISTAIPSPIGFAFGEIGKVQMDALRRFLQAESEGDGVRVIQLHHPPLFSAKRRYLRDGALFRGLVEEFGAELIISGHEHHFQMGSLTGPGGVPVPVISGPSASLKHHDGARAGGYLRYKLPARRGGTIEMTRYWFEPESCELNMCQQGPIAFANGQTYIGS